MGPDGIINTGQGQNCAMRESSLSIIKRDAEKHERMAEMYRWLEKAMTETPIANTAEQELWLLLTRERRY
jgi:hypothetical protein